MYGIDQTTIERAWAARRAMQPMMQSLTNFATALCGRPIKVVIDDGTPRTDGRTIYLRPPMILADKVAHVKQDCLARDPDSSKQLCPACVQMEAVWATCFHEIAHIAYETFSEVSDKDKAQIIKRTLKEMPKTPGSRIDKIKRDLDKIGKGGYLAAAYTISPYLKPIVNALEDARVNRAMYQARPGCFHMFRSTTLDIFNQGLVLLDGRIVRWSEAGPNAQAIVGLFCKASGYDYQDWFLPEVVEALNDEELSNVIAGIAHVKGAADVYAVAFPALECLRKYGLCKRPEDIEDDPPPPNDSEPSDNQQESDTNGESNQEQNAQDDDAGNQNGQGEDSTSGDASSDDDEEEGSTQDGASETDKFDVSSDEHEDAGVGTSNDSSDDQESDDASSDVDADDEGGIEGDALDDAQMFPGGDGDDSPDDGVLDDTDDQGGTSGDTEGHDGSGFGGFRPDQGGTESIPEDTDPEPEPWVDDTEDIENALKQFGDHADPTDEELQEQQRDEEALDLAIRQAQFFDEPSRYVSGVNVIDAVSYESNERANVLHAMADEPFDNVLPDGGLIATTLLKTRVAFAANHKARREFGHRAGRVASNRLASVATGNREVFTRANNPGKRDYFVSVTMDISGSTAWNNSGTFGSAPNIEIIRQLGAAIGELLNGVGVKFALHAHTAMRPEDGRWDAMDMDILKIKGVDDPWSDTSRDLISKLRPSQGNLDGHTLEWQRKLVERRTETDRMILYVTDGEMPASNYEEELMILQREIELCRRQKIQLIGVGVRTDSPSAHGLDTVQLDCTEDLPLLIKEIERRLAT